ncbi:hypothetical protein [Spirosoma spitsbergense]|uniref:hypothetical protein n=1 Tax=Spirosoma spitsbergense TaxID=431554 RepID=UPI0003A103A2|nr:hypothetical protein [Spirosoma spitsbergense]
MSFFVRIISRFRVPLFLVAGLFFSLVALAQVTLKYRLLTSYMLNADASVNKGRSTLLVFEQADEFRKAFKPDDTGKRPSPVNFTKETAIGIVIPPTSKPPKLSVSRVFVQDSVLTIRYIRLKDTTVINHPLPAAIQPMLLLAIPKQTVLKTRLIENGKVVQTITTRHKDS